MATLGALTTTLADIQRSLDPDGKIANIIPLLALKNGLLEHMTWKPSNMPLGHRTTVETSLPTVYTRKLNEGVPNSKNTTRQITEGVAMFVSRSQVDKKEADLSGDVNGFRTKRAARFMESMRQAVAYNFFYGNASVFEGQFTGLAPRYNTIAGGNVIDAGGVGSDNCSAYLIQFGENNVTGLYPKHLPAGLNHEDLKDRDAYDANGNAFRAYVDEFSWDCGLAVQDWRSVVRIANIDYSDLKTGSAANLTDLMIEAFGTVPNMGEMVKQVFVVPRRVGITLMKQAKSASAGFMGFEKATSQLGNNIMGLSFLGVPVVIEDSLLGTEARVV